MNNTKHNDNCTRVFKNYDLTCPRCLELKNGSQPRDGWQKRYYATKAQESNNLQSQMARHYASEVHKQEIVCTAFDW